MRRDDCPACVVPDLFPSRKVFLNAYDHRVGRIVQMSLSKAAWDAVVGGAVRAAVAEALFGWLRPGGPQDVETVVLNGCLEVRVAG